MTEEYSKDYHRKKKIPEASPISYWEYKMHFDLLSSDSHTETIFYWIHRKYLMD